MSNMKEKSPDVPVTSSEDRFEKVKIREATSHDLEDIHELQRLLADTERPYDCLIDVDGTKTAEKSGYVGYVNMEEKINSEDNYVVVAEAEDRAVGVSYGTLRVAIHSEECL